jgi:hypothetical protein
MLEESEFESLQEKDIFLFTESTPVLGANLFSIQAVPFWG